MSYFAIFEKTERDGNRVKAVAFQRKQLTRCEFSLAKLAHIDRQTFEAKVIKALIARQGPFVGIARANVGRLRSLRNNGANSGQAVCVIDKVTALDFDAHAALGYSESHKAVDEKRKPIVRATLHANLVDTFGDFISIEDTF